MCRGRHSFRQLELGGSSGYDGPMTTVRRTGLPLLLAALALLISSSPAARAGNFEDSQANLAKTYNDYFNAVLSSPNPSADAGRLSQQMIAPAAAAVGQAARRTMAETQKKIAADQKRKFRPIALKLPPGYDLKKAGAIKDAGPVTPAVRQNVPAAVTPKEVLDGSQVPRKVEFSGAKPAGQ
jgi:hypothetical protein